MGDSLRLARRAPVETLGDILDSLFLGERYAALGADVRPGLNSSCWSGCGRCSTADDACAEAPGADKRSPAGSLVALQQRMAASDLPAAARRWILRTLGVETADELTYAASYERPGIRLGAGLLLFLWDLRDSSSQLKEAYERYRRVAETELRLFVRAARLSSEPWLPSVQSVTSLRLARRPKGNPHTLNR